MPIDQIKLSQTAKDQLIKLKRRTRIKNWNTLCRWALCRSLAEGTNPSPVKIPADSSVEMTWKVFGGSHHSIYWGLVRQRCKEDGLDLTEDNCAEQFRLHLHRGIAYLAGDKDIRAVEDLVSRGTSAELTRGVGP